MNIAGVTLSKNSAEKIARAAIELADERGFCEEVDYFLEAMGFPIPDYSRTVTIQVRVSGRGGDLDNDYAWNVYHDTVETDSISILKVEDDK